MNINELLANANLAFGGGEYKLSLDYSRKAMQEDPKDFRSYVAAGKACISLQMEDQAEEYFKRALERKPDDGEIRFMLGYAQLLKGKTSSAVATLTKTVESSIRDATRGQVYKILSMINAEQGDYEDAILNIRQAEKYLKADYDLLRQHAACCASLNDYRGSMFVLNQMKLLRPKEYIAYSLAFRIFLDLGIFEEARAELEKAEKYAKLPVEYYFDRISLLLIGDKVTETNQKWSKTLVILEEALKKSKPKADDVFEIYMKAAQIYISLDNPERALRVLNAAVNPIFSFNEGFSLLDKKKQGENCIDDNIVLSPEQEEELMQERWDSGEFESLSEAINEVIRESDSEDSEELSGEIQAALSPVEVLPEKEALKERYSLSGEFSMTQIQSDMRNMLYVNAYEQLGRYNDMFEKARSLQASSIPANQDYGIYYELKVGKLLGKENWEKKYKERINYWTKRLIENPTDYVSASYRIKSYIDIGDYVKAEQLCECLPNDAKAPLMEEINMAKSQGGRDNVNDYQ